MTDLSVETPAEDWAEQNLNAVDAEPEPEPAAVRSGTSSEEVDVADRQEQLAPVYDADDEDHRA